MPWGCLVRSSKLFSRLVALSPLLSLLAGGGAVPVLAADVILDPGYIAGEIRLDGATVTGASLMATGGGYTSSRALGEGPYTVTVQGGDWLYQVWTSVAVAPPAGVPLTSIAFPERSFTVPIGATVTNDYHYGSAILRFRIANSGDPLQGWEADCGAEITDPAESAPTAFSASLKSVAGSQGSWDMVVIPSSSVGVGVNLTLYGGETYSFSFPGLSLSAGEVLEIPLAVDFTAPPPGGEDPPGGGDPPPVGTTGTIQGTFDLTGATDLASATIYCGPASLYLLQTPSSFRFQDLSAPGTYSFRVSNTFGDGRASLTWPLGGVPGGGQVSLAAGETLTYDLIQPAGFLAGAFLITGTLTNRDLSSCDLFLEGCAVLPLEGGGVGPSPTAGGSASLMLRGSAGVEDSYRLTLTPGPWSLYKLVFSRYALVEGAWCNFSSTIFDYSSTFDGAEFLGTPDQITGGQTLIHDREYSFGTVALRFIDTTGGAMSQPQLRGAGTILDEEGNTLFDVSFAAMSEAMDTVGPVVEVHGIPGTYTLNCSTTLADGSLVTFPPIEVTIVASVKQGKDLLGPELSVSSPLPDLVTNEFSLPVTGVAYDESGLAGVTVNGLDARLTPLPDPLKPGKVSFIIECPLADGANTIHTQAVDLLGNLAYDERQVLVDRTPPTVGVEVGSGSSVAVPVTITVSDLGYGFTLQVRYDDQFVWQGTGPSSLSLPATISWSGTVDTTTEGTHELSAIVTDRAGNSTTYRQPMVGGDQWPPVVSLSAPRDALVISSSGTFAIAATATDQGNGFTLTVSVDGAPLHTASGPADVTAPRTISWTGSGGPLPAGEHLVQALVTDLKGYSASAVSRVRVDGWAPLSSISYPANGATFRPGTTVSTSASGSDRGWGFTLTLSLDGVVQGTVSGLANPSTPAATSLYRYFSNLAPGLHTLEAVATDRAGNSSRTVSTFTVLPSLVPDTWSPSVTLTEPPDRSVIPASGTFPITASASDRGNGFTLTVRSDGTVLHSAAGPGNDAAAQTIAWSGTGGPLPAGEREVRAEVADLAGHTAAAVRRVRVDGWTPLAAISYPANGATFQSPAAVAVRADGSDQGWGFTLTLTLDGVIQGAADGPLGTLETASVSLSRSLAGLALGPHTLEAVAVDLAGNSHRAATTFVVVAPPPTPPAPLQVVRAEVDVQPLAVNGGANGMVTVFVKLPVGLTRNASCLLADTSEITAAPAQNPVSVSYDRGADRLIFKFRRTQTLLNDTTFTFRGLVRATPADPWSVWEGSDTIAKLPPASSLAPSSSAVSAPSLGSLLRFLWGR